MESQENNDQDQLLTQFISITGAEESIAKNTLEACDWNLEMAINMFVDSNLAGQTTSTSTSSISQPNDNHHQQQPNTSSINDTEQVRPPIQPIRQVLVEDYPRTLFNNISAFDGFRNFEQESRWQEQQIGESSQSSENKRKTFDELFRPPLDLIFRGNFEMAKFEGQRKDKWLMVNVQDPREFACQVLNRDVWSNSTVKSLIKKHFIFWQTYHDSAPGQNFISFYSVRKFPFISIIDPRTGEKMVSWHEIDTVTFCEKITQFLNDNPSPSGKDSKNSDDNFNDYPKATYDDNEQLQLEAAIKASLKDIEENPNHDSSDDDEKNSQTNKESWKDYLGSDESNKMEIVIRYPDGNKEKVMFPSDSKLKALFLYVTEHGHSMNEYDLITNFPKKNLSNCDEKDTLENVGIHSRDTLYVQTKN